MRESTGDREVVSRALLGVSGPVQGKLEATLALFVFLVGVHGGRGIGCTVRECVAIPLARSLEPAIR